MMFLDLIKTRRSIRKFSDKPVEKEKIDQILEAALRSPSSRSFNPWRFILVDRPDILEALSKAKPHGASFLKSAPLGIVVCADSSASDVWVEDCAIASIFIHLAAHSLKLGSCWIQIRKRDHDLKKSADTYIKEILDIPDSIRVESIVAIGYADEVKQGHGPDSLDHGNLFYNGFFPKE